MIRNLFVQCNYTVGVMLRLLFWLRLNENIRTVWISKCYVVNEISRRASYSFRVARKTKDELRLIYTNVVCDCRSGQYFCS